MASYGESSPFAGELIENEMFHEQGVIDGVLEEELIPQKPLIDDPRTEHVPWITILHSLLIITLALCISILAFLYIRKRSNRRQTVKHLSKEPMTDISYATVGGLPTIDEETPLPSFESLYHSFDLTIPSDHEY